MKWEDEGFASEEAYNKYQQTITDKEEEITTLNTRVEEKQKVIDGHRSKISDLTDVSKERDDLQADKAKLEEDLRKIKEEHKEPDPEPDDIKKQNEERISKLDPEQREKFQKKYNELTADQKDLLSKPEGMKAYLNHELDETTETSDNPFDVKKPALSIEDQVALLFGKQEKKAPVQPLRGAVTASDLPDEAKDEQKDRKQEIAKARSNFI